MYHPPRGGVRGGRDQFNCMDVKTDKHRENYLGHSVYAPVGRWQQGKDLTWYAKDGKKDDSHRKEIEALKEVESDVMAELLGGGKRRVVTGNVTQQELTNVLKRQQEDDEGDELKETIQEVTKGFRSSGRLSISEMVPDNTRLIPEDNSTSITNLEDKNIAENIQRPTIQLEDRKKSKKINKEKKKKKRKKDKHHGSSKKKHSKRSKRDLSASSSRASNESIRGRSRYRKIDNHTGSRDHSGEPRPYSISPKRDTGRYRSQSPKRQNRSRSTSIRRNITQYISRSNSPKRDINSKSPRRDAIRYHSRSKSPRRGAIQYHSRSKSPRRDAI
ncbi:kinase phosphorylation protein, partial [Glomus cerebriforme]